MFLLRYSLVAWAVFGCAEATHTEMHDDELELKAIEASGECARRWIPDVERHRTFDVSRTSARTQCSGGPQPGAVTLGRFVREHFGDILNDELTDGSVQIYNCRRVRGGTSRSVHGDGRAIDFMIPTVNGQADNRAGDRLANWLLHNAEYIGVQYIIWDRTKWHPTQNRTGACYGGRHDHADHVHVELTWAAARQESSFFRDLQNGNASAPQSNGPSGDNPASPREPSNPIGGWIGADCQRDEDCGELSNGDGLNCLANPEPGSSTGMCSTSCEGYCPDRVGAPRTFCIAGDIVGQPLEGVCVAEALSANDFCRRYDQRVSVAHWRHLGQASVSVRQADVCVFTTPPAESPTPDPVLDPEPSLDDAPEEPLSPQTEDSDHERFEPDTETDEPEPQTAEPVGNDMCRDASLLLSDHDWPCDGVPHNTWRCACSERFEQSVSQVCRDGAWINYELNPRDCSRCEGRYTQGCEP